MQYKGKVSYGEMPLFLSLLPFAALHPEAPPAPSSSFSAHLFGREGGAAAEAGLVRGSGGGGNSRVGTVACEIF